ncbi:MAG: ABC transporter permease, partial [Bacteroidetes bacterium]|nr:ABC transporter permease [Bacteroidota bacterium]
PAMMLSSFRIVNVLKGTLKYTFSGAALRKGLVVFQFTLSILLIIGTLTIYQQINYIRTKNLGLDKDNLLYMPLEGNISKQYEAFSHELMQKPGIVSLTTSSQDPLSVGNSTSDPTWDGKDPNSSILFSIINANYDFINTMKMDILHGRTFSKEFSTDTANYIINEATAKAMGKENPIGESMEFWQRKGKVIGVVKDFHFSSLYSTIDPLIIRLSPEETYMLFVRVDGAKTEEALAGIQEIHQKFNPSYPLKYTFLDENFERTYKSEFTTGKLANIFALMAVFISCLGLFGLASFTAAKRTREISIRKVLGASAGNLVMLLFRDFTWLVAVAFAIAAPIAWYAMQEWLSGFEYHVDLNVWVFALSGVSAIVIAWLTIGYQSLKAALANPVESLRMD